MLVEFVAAFLGTMTGVAVGQYLLKEEKYPEAARAPEALMPWQDAMTGKTRMVTLEEYDRLCDSELASLKRQSTENIDEVVSELQNYTRIKNGPRK